jgi:hypothetical protein
MACVTVIAAVRGAGHDVQVIAISAGDGLGARAGSFSCHLPVGGVRRPVGVDVGGGAAGSGAERVDRVECRLQGLAVEIARGRAEDQPPSGAHDP